MEYSDTYLEILEEGEAKGARKFLLRLGQKQFGVPDRATKAALEAITDPERLEQLGERVLEVSSWQELLATPRTQRRPRRPNRES
jgi:hypothetical protein